VFKAKKGLFASDELAGLLVLMFVAIIAIFAFYIGNVLDQSKKQKQVEVSLDDLNVDYNLVSFLHFKYDEDKTIVDLISESYLNNDYEKLRDVSNKFFAGIYNEKGISYDLIIEDRSINSINFVGLIIQSSVQIPTMAEKVINVELVIGNADTSLPYHGI